MKIALGNPGSSIVQSHNTNHQIKVNQSLIYLGFKVFSLHANVLYSQNTDGQKSKGRNLTIKSYNIGINIQANPGLHI